MNVNENLEEQPGVDEVRDFWEESPLFSGESDNEVGSKDFFFEHRKIYMEECFGGSFDERFLPKNKDKENAKILDLGCGIGFWVTEFGLFDYKNLYAADLTKTALNLTEKRLSLYGIEAELSQENAEKTNFNDNFFDHVNCQGVIHHTPDTEAAVKEIHRILKSGGSASISVYYKNFFLRNWRFLSVMGYILNKFGSGLKGRGRENIYLQKDVNEIVRLYDGDENPIGKSYSKKEFLQLLKGSFEIDETYLHFFPTRSLPFKIPKIFQKILDKYFGFMIYASLTKK